MENKCTHRGGKLYTNAKGIYNYSYIWRYKRIRRKRYIVRRTRQGVKQLMYMTLRTHTPYIACPPPRAVRRGTHELVYQPVGGKCDLFCVRVSIRPPQKFSRFSECLLQHIIAKRKPLDNYP